MLSLCNRAPRTAAQKPTKRAPTGPLHQKARVLPRFAPQCQNDTQGPKRLNHRDARLFLWERRCTQPLLPSPDDHMQNHTVGPPRAAASGHLCVLPHAQSFFRMGQEAASEPTPHPIEIESPFQSPCSVQEGSYRFPMKDGCAGGNQHAKYRGHDRGRAHRADRSLRTMRQPFAWLSQKRTIPHSHDRMPCPADTS